MELYSCIWANRCYAQYLKNVADTDELFEYLESLGFDTEKANWSWNPSSPGIRERINLSFVDSIVEFVCLGK